MTAAFRTRWLDSKDRSAYEALHLASRGSAPFNSLRWWETLFAEDNRFRLLGTFDEDRLVAVVAFLAQTRNGYRTFDLPLPTPHSTLLASDESISNNRRLETTWKSIAESMLKFLAAQPRLGIAAIQFPPSWTDARPWQWGGATVFPNFTYICSLESLEQWEASWTTSVRSRVRKARESGWHFECPARPEDFIPLWLRTLHEEGLPIPVDLQRLRRVMKLATEQEWGAIALCRPPGAPIEAPSAGAFVLWANGTAYHLLAASSQEGKREGAPSFLLAQVGEKLAREKKILRYDLCGANVPDVAEFKKSFGGILTPYWIAHYEGRTYRALRTLRDWFTGK